MPTEPPSITFASRAAVAEGEPFRPWHVRVHSPDAALDVVRSYRADAEPMLLRLSADGDVPPDPSVDGDWFCDAGGEDPRLLPPPDWTYNTVSRFWARAAGRRWVDAWEACPDARWSLHAVARHVARPLLVLAVCDCARLALHPVGGGRSRDEAAAAVDAAEAWARGEASLAAVRRAAGASWSLNAKPDEMSAVEAASLAATTVYGGAVGSTASDVARYAASALAEAGTPTHLALGQMARLVRSRIPTPDALRDVPGP